MLAMMRHGIPWDVARRTNLKFGIRLLQADAVAAQERAMRGVLPEDADVPGVVHLTPQELGKELARDRERAARGG